MPRANRSRTSRAKKSSNQKKKEGKRMVVPLAMAGAWAGKKLLKGAAGKVAAKVKGKLAGGVKGATATAKRVGVTRKGSVAKLRTRIQRKLLKLREAKVNRMLLREQLRV